MNLYSSVLTIETAWRIWLKEVKTRKNVLETCMSHLENTSMWEVLIEWWFSSSFNLLSEKRNPQKIAFSHFATRKRILLPRGGRFSRRYQALFVAQALSEKSHVDFSIKLPLFFMLPVTVCDRLFCWQFYVLDCQKHIFVLTVFRRTEDF